MLVLFCATAEPREWNLFLKGCCASKVNSTGFECQADRYGWDEPPDAKPLFQNERCDVVVIGAGIAGISTAYELACRKLSVIVVDRGSIARGMTARTTAHLAPLCDDLMSEMTKLRGLDASKVFYESQAASVDRIEEIQKSENIDCDFRRLDGYLFQGNGMPPDIIDKELEAVREVARLCIVWLEFH